MRLRLKDRASERLPRRSHLPTLLLYLAAAALYIGVGLINDNFLLSMPVGAAFLLIVVWLVPAIVRRFR